MLFRAIKSKPPHVLILDLNLPDMAGLEIIKKIRDKNDRMKILILTMHNDPFLIRQVKSLGANGYLLKDFGRNELLESLDCIFEGEYYVSPNLSYEEEGLNGISKFRLTKREKEIIKFSAEGKSSSEIAEHLFLSPHTVNTHRRNIYKKLGLSNIKELIKFAYDEGIA